MSFQDIKGQDKAIEILKEHIRQSRLSSGYLFVGPEGVGKKMVAKTLAKTVNCQNETLDASTTLERHGERPSTSLGTSVLEFIEGRSRTIDSCDRCASCLKIDKNQHPDVSIINASATLNSNYEQGKGEAGNSQAIKIGHIRQLQKYISLKPYEAKLKVFIIDNAHHLTPEASNALLKILEEPPVNSLIILVSAKPTLLFKTIISRCQIVKFYPLAREQLREVLNRDYGLETNLAHFLAYFCEGRLGRALALKDTEILREKNRIIDTFALSRKPGLENLSIKNREDVRNILNILTTWFRDMYLIKIGIPHLELINFDRKSELLKFMQHFSFMDLDEILNSISDSLTYLEQNINIKLLLANLSEAITYGARSAT